MKDSCVEEEARRNAKFAANMMLLVLTIALAANGVAIILNLLGPTKWGLLAANALACLVGFWCVQRLILRSVRAFNDDLETAHAIREMVKQRRHLKLMHAPTPGGHTTDEYLCILQGVDPRDESWRTMGVPIEWQAWADSPEAAVGQVYKNFQENQHGVPSNDS